MSEESGGSRADWEHGATASDQVVVSLRILGDALVPSDVSRLLEMIPSRAHALGDPVRERPGRKYPSGCWILNRPRTGTPPDQELQTLAMELLDKEAELARLRANGNATSLVCGLFSASEDATCHVSSETMQLLCRLGVTLELRSYYVGGDPDSVQSETSEPRD
jgi:hypothetical protein